jgi:hypothetical protein
MFALFIYACTMSVINLAVQAPYLEMVSYAPELLKSFVMDIKPTHPTPPSNSLPTPRSQGNYSRRPSPFER